MSCQKKPLVCDQELTWQCGEKIVDPTDKTQDHPSLVSEFLNPNAITFQFASQ